MTFGAAQWGCGDEEPGPLSTNTTRMTEQTTVSTTQAPTTASSSESPRATVPLSGAALAYAEDLGGISHLGHALYLVVGTTAGSEDKARTLLDEVTPLFGDMQSCFMVQNSSNLEAMKLGHWVVMEAYRGEPSAENLDFARRAFPDAYVKEATALTEDPVPVYEEIIGL